VAVNFSSDGFHPNAVGYERFAAKFTAFLGTTRTVINTNAAGAGSLRQALLDASRLPGSDTINFALPAGGPSIVISTAPALDSDVSIRRGQQRLRLEHRPGRGRVEHPR
jgi:hypothetical protein